MSGEIAATAEVILGEHFVMWQEVAERAPSGDWVCSCGTKFGFSDSAITHVAAKVAEALAGWHQPHGSESDCGPCMADYDRGFDDGQAAARPGGDDV